MRYCQLEQVKEIYKTDSEGAWIIQQNTEAYGDPDEAQLIEQFLIENNVQQNQ